MPFQKVNAEKLSVAVVRQIELLILRGVLRPGERLPPERDLAAKLAVSRPSLREAISVLQQGGLLTARAGAGIFVAEVLGSAFSPALVRLFAGHDEAVFDMLAFRRDMEGLAAERAAKLASDTDLAVIGAIFVRMEASDHSESDGDLDVEFHMAIIDMRHNVIMLHMMRSMYDLMRDGVFYNRQIMFSQNTTKAELLDQHRAINDALQARDPRAARGAVEAHLDYVLQAFRDHKKAVQNEDIARQKLAHDGVRG